jgi:hypothetical protein
VYLILILYMKLTRVRSLMVNSPKLTHEHDLKVMTFQKSICSYCIILHSYQHMHLNLSFIFENGVLLIGRVATPYSHSPYHTWNDVLPPPPPIITPPQLHPCVSLITIHSNIPAHSYHTNGFFTISHTTMVMMTF